MGSVFTRTRRANGKPVKEKKWTIKFQAADGSWRTEVAYVDKEASRAFLTRREDTVPLCETLASALLEWHDAEKRRLGRAPRGDERVVHVGSRFRDSFKADYEAAGIKETDAAGQYFDYHALRHWFATWLAEAGTHPKVAQELLRHTDVRLTLRYYTHTTAEQKTAALASLPTLEKCAPNSTTHGTTDSTTEMADGGETCSDVSGEGKAAVRPTGGEHAGERANETRAGNACQPQSGWWRRGESNPILGTSVSLGIT